MGRWAKGLTVAAIVVTGAPPATGQTIVDTFRQLKSTVGQLGGRRRQAPPAADAVPPAATASAENGDAMVPQSVTIDDASDTRLEAAPLLARRVSTFDIRGLKLGMSPREVGRVADRQRFRRRWNSLLLTTGTFDLEAARLANMQLGRPVDRTSKVQLKAVQGWDPAGAELKCEFTLEPTGPKLSRIEYRAKLDGTTADQAFQALVRKYGPPNGRYDDAISHSWSNAAGPVDGSSPSLFAVVDGGEMALTLDQSSDYQHAAQKRLQDKARQIAAAHGAGVKF